MSQDDLRSRDAVTEIALEGTFGTAGSSPSRIFPVGESFDLSRERTVLARRIQPIFQDPYSSLNPRKSIEDIIALPLAAPATAALTVILFVYGWHQYLWPLLITTDERMATVVMGGARTLPSDNAETRWGLTMGRALVAMAPPVILVILLQRRLVAGLTDVGK